jgi:hypothetical protein
VSLQLPARRLRDGRPVLAIPVGSGRNEIVLTKLRGLRTAPGFRVGTEGVGERFLEGFYQEGGRLYLYGPWEPGPTLEEVLQGGEALPHLARLARALVRLGERRPQELATDAVRFLEDGAVELLSPQVMRQARNMQTEEHRRRTYDGLNHPDAKSLSYCLAALLYRQITGDYPFAAASGEEMRRRARELRLAPLSLSRPEVREEVSAAVMDGLGRGRGAPPTLEQWAALLEDWAGSGLFRQLSEAEAQALAAKARRADEQASRAYRRGVFWQRHWRTVLIVAAAAVAAGVFSGTVLRNLLKPRSTRGLEPLEVVRTFYESANTLDHERMQDCVAGRAGKELIEQVIHVFVIGRVNLGYEGRSRIRSAAEWDRAGRPPVVPPDAVFGITDLRITALAAGAEPSFRASYLRWLPDPGQGTVSQPVRERLFLRQQGGAWVIHRLEPEVTGEE